jgi:hypothetical protein
MNVAQLGQQVKTKYPQYAKMDDTQVGNAVLQKFPVYKAQITDTAPSLNPTSIENALPGAGGILGQIIGGGLGTAGGAVAGGGPEDIPADVIGEKLGQTAGGAVGQAGGDFLKQFLNTISGNQKSINPGEILGQGAEGALYGATPGGKTGAGIIKNLLVRGAGGAAVGGGAQAIENIQQGKPAGQQVGQAAAVGGALNAGTGGLLDSLRLVRGTGGKVADDIENTVVKRPQQAKQEAIREAHETMVSPKQTDFAIENGILDPNKGISSPHIAQALQKTQQIGTDVENSIQNTIKGIPVSDAEQKQLNDGINAILAKHGLSPINAKSLEKQLGQQEYATIQRVRNLLYGQLGTDPIDLTKVQQAKRLIAPLYDEKGAMGELYRYLQKSIEDKSGKPDVVKELNQQARNVAEIRQHLIKSQEKGIPHRLTDQGIREQVEKSKQKVSPELKNFAHVLDLLGGTAGFVVGHGFLGYLIGKGVAESAARAAESPDEQARFASALRKILLLNPTRASKMSASSAKQLLQGLGIRLTPALMQSNSQ